MGKKEKSLVEMARELAKKIDMDIAKGCVAVPAETKIYSDHWMLSTPQKEFISFYDKIVEPKTSSRWSDKKTMPLMPFLTRVEDYSGPVYTGMTIHSKTIIVEKILKIDPYLDRHMLLEKDEDYLEELLAGMNSRVASKKKRLVNKIMELEPSFSRNRLLQQAPTDLRIILNSLEEDDEWMILN